MSRRAAKSADDAAPRSGLTGLLSCERELDELRQQAEAEAGRRVSEAHEAAVAERAALDSELEEECARVRSRLREQAEREVDRIRARAEARSTRLDALTDEDVDRLAAMAYRRLIAGEGAA